MSKEKPKTGAMDQFVEKEVKKDGACSTKEPSTPGALRETVVKETAKTIAPESDEREGNLAVKKSDQSVSQLASKKRPIAKVKEGASTSCKGSNTSSDRHVKGRSRSKTPPRKKGRPPQAKVATKTDIPSLQTGRSALPTDPVANRLGARMNEARSEPLTPAEERQLLMLEHRACHEALRSRVLSTVTNLLQSLASADHMTVSEAQTELNTRLAEFQLMLDDMLYRQRMESMSLAACQLVDSTVGIIPDSGILQPAVVVAVSFPFPSLFDEARAQFSSFVLHRRLAAQQRSVSASTAINSK